MKRTGKFYNRREKEIMQKFGFKPTPQSGGGWIIKEDGQNSDFICQLKSTEANSYRVSLDDIDKLEYHAVVENKIPFFMVDFIGREEQYLLFRASDLFNIVNILERDKKPLETKIEALELITEENEKKVKTIKNRKSSESLLKELNRGRYKK